MERNVIIAVIGGGRCSPEEAALAEETGRLLARHNAILMCGGLGGVMEAACKGAAAENGVTIGVLPGENRADANSYVQIPIVSGIGHARNAIVARSAHAVIAIGGAYGTLTEIAFALLSGTPVIGIGTWSVSRGGEPDSSILQAATAVDAVELAVDLARARLAEEGQRGGVGAKPEKARGKRSRK